MQYERRKQISNGATSSVFCIAERKRKPDNQLFAAKYLKAGTTGKGEHSLGNRPRKFTNTVINRTIIFFLNINK